MSKIEQFSSVDDDCQYLKSPYSNQELKVNLSMTFQINKLQDSDICSLFSPKTPYSNSTESEYGNAPKENFNLFPSFKVSMESSKANSPEHSVSGSLDHFSLSQNYSESEDPFFKDIASVFSVSRSRDEVQSNPNPNPNPGVVHGKKDLIFQEPSNMDLTTCAQSQLLMQGGRNTQMFHSLLPLEVKVRVEITPRLVNIVSTAHLEADIDLRGLARKAMNVEYNPKRFSAAIMRIRQPKATGLIFSNGKLICCGAKSEEESRIAARRIAKTVHKLGFKCRFTQFLIRNMVASCFVGFKIRLEGLNCHHSNFCIYDPEVLKFPGLIYRMTKPKIVLLIFASGKIILTGAKNKHDLYHAFQNIYPVLSQFKK